MTVEKVCKDYLAIADAAGIDRFAAIGYSWGGNSVLQLATRSQRVNALAVGGWPVLDGPYDLLLQTTEKLHRESPDRPEDRKSTRLNSSHANISYAVFCLKKKNNTYI